MDYNIIAQVRGVQGGRILVERGGGGGGGGAHPPGFSPVQHAEGLHCKVECYNSTGSTLNVHVKGQHTSNLSSLSLK